MTVCGGECIIVRDRVEIRSRPRPGFVLQRPVAAVLLAIVLHPTIEEEALRQPNETKPRSAIKLLALSLVLLCLAPLLIATVIEGGASFLLFANAYRRAQAPTGVSRPHTQHDTLVGWVNKKNFASPDEYGAGVALTTDSSGFRFNTLAPTVDRTQAQLVCSGDSFTLGYGVTDNAAWCALLQQELPGLRTVNMGQGAYGLDQAYLWFKRDAPSQHAVQVFAMIDVQFDRATTANYQGRIKPLLAMSDNRLVVRNTPVPVQTTEALRRAYSARLLNDLRIVQLFRSFSFGDGAAKAQAAVDERWPLFERVFTELDSINRARGSALVLMYLPTRRDAEPGPLDARRARIATFASSHNIRLVDLTMSMRALPADSLDMLFIARAPANAAPGVPGHYSVAGNAWVARLLSRELVAVPALSALQSNSANAR